MTRVAILGATGSIGRQALEVIAGDPDLEVVALAAASDVDGVARAAAATGCGLLALADPAAAAALAGRTGGDVLAGPDGLVELVRRAEADVVLNAVVGAAGLEASLAALAAGADLALANKESLVAGGPLVREAVRRSGRRLLPVDSEHSALLQCIGDEAPEAIESVVLTASGGPFRGRTRAELVDVGVEDALAHPTWAMGAKITVDSATLMNKGLEVIEAHELFDLPYDRIEVVVHPQSIVHGMARLVDGALIAHVGLPDMRVPIAYALRHPARRATDAPRLDLTRAFSLDFEPPDTETFRCLALARAAGTAGGTAPAILNGANEEAVAAFLAGRCRFLAIAELVEAALDAVEAGPVDGLEAVRAADAAARAAVRAALARTQAGVAP